MKTFRFISYLFFRYYSKGARADIPYCSTIGALAMLFYLHLVQLFVILGTMNLIPGDSTDTRLIKYFKIALFFLPIFILFSLLIKKRELQEMHYDDNKIKRGNFFLVGYSILSISLTIFLMVIKNGR
jgi:amino acid permease